MLSIHQLHILPSCVSWTEQRPWYSPRGYCVYIGWWYSWLFSICQLAWECKTRTYQFCNLWSLWNLWYKSENYPTVKTRSAYHRQIPFGFTRMQTVEQISDDSLCQHTGKRRSKVTCSECHTSETRRQAKRKLLDALLFAEQTKANSCIPGIL